MTIPKSPEASKHIEINVRVRAMTGPCLVDKEGDLFRIMEVPSPLFGGHFEFRDLVRLAPCEDHVLEFVEVITAARWRRFDFLLSRSQVASEALPELLSKVDALGGAWMREFEGSLSIALPPTSSWDPGSEFEELR